jgi:hypothetical protein
MNLRWRVFPAFAIAVFVCVSASTAFAETLPNSSSWVQHKVSSGSFPIRSACMMPPQIHLVRIGMKGAESPAREAEAWAQALNALVESHLKSDGIAINSATNPLSTGASADEIRSAISQVQEKLDAISPLMHKKPGRIGKAAYTLGDQAGTLPCSENSDILVFVKGVGQVLTDGRTTMNFFIGGPGEDAVVFVTLADARTGEILGFIRMRPSNDGYLGRAEDAFGDGLDYGLETLNIGSARKNARARGR